MIEIEEESWTRQCYGDEDIEHDAAGPRSGGSERRYRTYTAPLAGEWLGGMAS